MCTFAKFSYTICDKMKFPANCFLLKSTLKLGAGKEGGRCGRSEGGEMGDYSIIKICEILKDLIKYYIKK